MRRTPVGAGAEARPGHNRSAVRAQRTAHRARTRPAAPHRACGPRGRRRSGPVVAVPSARERASGGVGSGRRSTAGSRRSRAACGSPGDPPGEHARPPARAVGVRAGRGSARRRAGGRTAVAARTPIVSEQEVPLGHRQLGDRVPARPASPSMRTVKVSGSTSMRRQRAVARPGRPWRRGRQSATGDQRPVAAPSVRPGRPSMRRRGTKATLVPPAPTPRRRTSAGAAPAAASGWTRWRRPSAPTRSCRP